MRQWSARLTSDVGLTTDACAALGTMIATELHELSVPLHSIFDDGTAVGFEDRVAEIIGFQGFMEATVPIQTSPYVSRARFLVQNYVCFVYLKEAWLERLGSAAANETAIHRCSSFLTSGRVRAFRNAFSHARWRYADDFTGVDYWDRASSRRDAPLQRFHVDQSELDFWQALTRCVSYVTAELLRESKRLAG